MSTLQTLERGLVALEAIAKRAEGMTTAELAGCLGVHRAIVYRIVSTLENHGLIVRVASGNFVLGGQIMALSARFRPQLRVLAQPVLDQLAQDTNATTFLSLAEGGQCVAVATAEPEVGVLRVSYRVGSRHPLTAGAAGIAILAGRPPSSGDAPAVKAARAAGYALTTGHIQAGATGAAAPIPFGENNQFSDACVGLVTMGGLDTRVVGKKVIEAAAEIGSSLRRAQ